MIAACFNTRDEVHIIGCTVQHALSQGVDHCWVMDWGSTDGTLDILHELDGVTVVPQIEDRFYWTRQGDYTSVMADIYAAPAGAEWIIATDADEFWTGTYGSSVAEAVNALPKSVNAVQASIFQYVDFDHRSLRPYPWAKVCYRWSPGLVVVPGNHHIIGGSGGVTNDALLVHELKFQSYEHFKFKMYMKSKVPWSDSQWLRDDGFVRGENASLTGGDVVNEDGDDVPESERQSYWKWMWEEVENVSLPSRFRPGEWVHP